MYSVHTFSPCMYLVHTFFLKYVLIMYQVHTSTYCSEMYVLKYILELKSMYLVHTGGFEHGMYRYVLSTYPFYWFGTAFLSFLRGTYGHRLRISVYILCGFCNVLQACPALPVCLQAIHALEHIFNQSTLSWRFINCLAGPLPVPASALHHWHDWALALACWGMQLRRVSFERHSVVKFWDDDQ